MKAIKSLFVFVISVTLASSCLDRPEFPDKPEITFESIYFGDHPNAAKPDSIVISLRFKDGDGDLGLPANALDSPFHLNNFFVNNGGQLTPVISILNSDFSGLRYPSSQKTPRDASFILGFIPSSASEVITFDSRSAGFPSLPAFSTEACNLLPQSYLVDTVFIDRTYKRHVRKSSIVDSLAVIGSNTIVGYAVLDTFYMEVNPRHYNIEVEFLVNNGNGTFVEFNWPQEYCTTYDGRFPVLAENDGPLEGVLDYSMRGTGFLDQFSIKQMKLRITIRDRANHISNTVETGVFNLEKIKK